MNALKSFLKFMLEAAALVLFAWLLVVVFQNLVPLAAPAKSSTQAAPTVQVNEPNPYPGGTPYPFGIPEIYVYESPTPEPSWTPYPTNTAKPGPKATPIPQVKPANNPAGKIVFLQKEDKGKKNAFEIEMDDKGKTKGQEKKTSEDIPFGDTAFLSPDGKQVLVWVSDGLSNSTGLLDLASGKFQIVRSLGNIWGWFPDGKWILVGGEGIFLVEPFKSTDKIIVAAHQIGTIRGAAASPDGQKIVYKYESGKHKEIWIIDSDGRNGRILLNAVGGTDFSWSPDSQLIAWWGNGLVLMTPEGEILHTIDILPPPDCDISPAWSPDGRYLLSTAVNPSGGMDILCSETIDPALSPSIYLVDVTTGQATTIIDNGYDPAWSPDGSQIAFISMRSGAPEVWVVNADGSNPRQLTHAAKWVRFLYWLKP